MAGSAGVHTSDYWHGESFRVNASRTPKAATGKTVVSDPRGGTHWTLV